MVLGIIVLVIVGILTVNYFKDKKGQTLPDALTTGRSIKEHVVVKGESLWSIAEKELGSGYKWKDLAIANGLNTSILEVGQKLNLPELTKPETAQAINSSSYTVVKGDSLWKIAVRAYGDGFAWTRIATANNLKNPSLIHSGNVLTIPR